MKFEIPQIRWEESLEMGFDGCFRPTHISKNTYFEYAIQKEHGLFYCYYGNGRFREFDCLDKAKEWVETVHYPNQIKKYFRVVA